MHPPPPAYHGRSNVPNGPKPTPLPIQNKLPLMANNIIPTAIQQRPQPLLRPKTILKHPSQYKSTITQPQIKQPPPSHDATNQSAQTNVPSSSSTSTSHTTTSQSHSNNLSGSHVTERPKAVTTSENKLLKGKYSDKMLTTTATYVSFTG